MQKNMYIPLNIQKNVVYSLNMWYIIRQSEA